MPDIIINFHDGEILHGRIDDLAFDHPLLRVDIRSVHPNNERALVPLAAIREMIVEGPLPPPDGLAVRSWSRTAFHFVDGGVLRASVSPETSLSRYAGIWKLIEPGANDIQVLAIPYSSLKAVFDIRTWDSRPLLEQRTAGAEEEQRVRTLAHQGAPHAAELHRPQRPLLNRIRKGPAA